MTGSGARAESNEANADARGRAPIFLPALLQDVDLQLLLSRRGSVSLATSALNRSGEAVGSHERGDSLVAAGSDGFEALQCFKVWNRSAV